MPSSAPMTGKEDLERADRFRLLREALGVGQYAMGQKVGISQSAWAHYESGICTPSPKHLDKIQRATGCPPEWLREGKILYVPRDLLEKIELAQAERLRRQRTKRN